MKKRLIITAAAFSLVLPLAVCRAAPAATTPPSPVPAAPAAPAKAADASAASKTPTKGADADAAFTKGIVGTWSETQAGMPGSPAAKISHTYGADGAWKSDATFEMMGQSMTASVAGTWKVADGFLVTTVETSVPAGMVPKGETDKERIVSVTANEVTVIEDTGEKLVKTRVGKAPGSP